MIGMSKGVIYGLFFMFLVIGALLGLKRGLTKAVIRFITVFVCCILTIFLVKPITSAILTADLSSTGFTIGEIPLTNLNDTLIAYVGGLLGVGDLLNASPTLVALIKSIPAILVNLILFVLLFFIFKGILYFVDIILNRVIIKKDLEKSEKRVWGAVVGGVQGLICFLFCFIPIAGTMNVLTDTKKVVDEANSPQTANVSMVSLSASADVIDDIDDIDDEDDLDTEEVKVQTNTVIDAYNDTFIVKMFNVLGYRPLSNVIYDKLTTIEIDKETSTTFRKEAITFAKIVNGYEKLKDVDIAEFSETDMQNANQLIDDAFESPLIGGIATEVVSGIADTWATTEPKEFIGIAKPDLDPKLLNTFDTLLMSIRLNNKEDMKNDMKVIVQVVKVSADHDLTSSINTGDTELLISALGKEGCMEEVIKTLSTGKSTKLILPSFIEFGVSYGYDAVGLDGTEIEITASAKDVNWETESVILGNLFEGVSATYKSSKGEGEILSKLDLVSFAKVLDSIRASELLDEIDQEMTINFLSSNLLDGVDCDTFIGYVQNDTTYESLDFGVTLSTLKSSAGIASDIKDITSGSGEVTELDHNEVGDLISGLTGADEATKEVMKDLASKENLEKSGADSATADAVNVLVGSLTEYDTTADDAVSPPESEEEKQNATNAVEDLLIASKNAKSSDPSQQIFETEEKMENFIDSMLSSPFVWAVTIDKGVELGFKTASETCLTATEQTWLDDILAEKQTSGACSSEQATQLRAMFIPE